MGAVLPRVVYPAVCGVIRGVQEERPVLRHGTLEEADPVPGVALGQVGRALRVAPGQMSAPGGCTMAYDARSQRAPC